MLASELRIAQSVALVRQMPTIIIGNGIGSAIVWYAVRHQSATAPTRTHPDLRFPLTHPYGLELAEAPPSRPTALCITTAHSRNDRLFRRTRPHLGNPGGRLSRWSAPFAV